MDLEEMGFDTNFTITDIFLFSVSLIILVI